MTPKVLVVTSSLARFTGDPLAAHGNAVAGLLGELGMHVTGTVLAPMQTGAPLHSRIGGLTVRRVLPARPDAALYQALRGPGILRIARLGISLTRASRALAPEHDVVHGMWAYPAGLAAVSSGRPSVVTFPGSDIHAFADRPIAGSPVRWVLRHGHVCVGVDPAGAAILAGLGARCVETIPTPINLDDVPMRGAEPGSGLVCVGRLSAEKGVDVLLAAMALVRRTVPSAHLTVVGDGPEAPRLRALAASLGLAESVCFTGALARPDALAHMARSQVLVIPSRREGLPSVALEALATGRPVVASAVGGLSDLLADGAGVVVPAGSAELLAAGIERALAASWDPPALRSRVMQFDQRTVAQRYLALYERVAAGALPAKRHARGCQQPHLGWRGARV
ncbi:MAG: glycosyltransferase [Acidimicrobiales bacterium]